MRLLLHENNTMRLTDRQMERRELRQLAGKPGAHLAVLYGRRRIGKTYLLQHIWEKASIFYYLASDTTPEFNRREFIEELAAHTGRTGALKPEDLGTWRAVFRELLRVPGQEPFVIILDEFQYLLGGEDDVRSQPWDLSSRGSSGRPTSDCARPETCRPSALGATGRGSIATAGVSNSISSSGYRTTH